MTGHDDPYIFAESNTPAPVRWFIVHASDRMEAWEDTLPAAAAWAAVAHREGVPASLITIEQVHGPTLSTARLWQWTPLGLVVIRHEEGG